VKLQEPLNVVDREFEIGKRKGNDLRKHKVGTFMITRSAQIGSNQRSHRDQWTTCSGQTVRALGSCPDVVRVEEMNISRL
jgi:hypothetical protein